MRIVADTLIPVNAMRALLHLRFRVCQGWHRE